MTQPLNGLSKAYYDIASAIEGKVLTRYEIGALCGLLLQSTTIPLKGDNVE